MRRFYQTVPRVRVLLTFVHVPNTYQLFATPGKVAHRAHRKTNDLHGINGIGPYESLSLRHYTFPQVTATRPSF